MYEYERDDLQGLVEYLNAETRQSGHELMFKYCPICGSSASDKYTSSINVDKGLFNCKRGSCPSPDLNFFQLCREVGYQIPRLGQIKYYKYKQIPEKERDCRQEAVDYLKSRAIPEEITRRYYITTKRDDPELLVIPFYDENDVCQMYKYRHTKPKPEGANSEWHKESFHKPKDMEENECTKRILFGMWQCSPDKDDRLIITEGQLDSMSVAAAGYANAVSVPNGKNGFTWVDNCREWIEQNFKKIIVFGDYENGEISLLDKITQEFNMPVLSVRPIDYLNCKDANDILREYGIDEIRKAVENAEPAGLDGIMSISDVKIFDISKAERVATGFRSIDRTTGGLIMGKLYVVTGKRGEGKSTATSQMLVNILGNSDEKILAYSGELPNGVFQEWLYRQSSQAFQIEKIESDVFGTEYRLSDERVAKLNQRYKDRLYLVDDSFTGDVMGLISKAAKCLGVKIILIDNLMSLVAREDNVRDVFVKQSQVANQLAAMARSLNVVIILIAHPKKGSEKERDSLDAISGSGDIVNAADYVFSYFKIDNSSGGIEILKNRTNGKSLSRASKSEIKVSYDEITKRIIEENALDKFRQYHGREEVNNGSFED